MVTLVVVAERSVITVSGQAVALFFLARARWRLAVSLSTAECGTVSTAQNAASMRSA